MKIRRDIDGKSSKYAVVDLSTPTSLTIASTSDMELLYTDTATLLFVD